MFFDRAIVEALYLRRIKSCFLIYQDHHGDILETVRDALLTNAVVVLQRAMKKFLRQRKRHKQACAAVLIQKNWKGYQDKRAYQKVGDITRCRSQKPRPDRRTA